jgi:hypothetical protein
MDPLDLKRSIVLAAVLGFIIVSVTVPFHQNVKGPCYTRAGAVWSMTRNGAGQLTTGWERNFFNVGAPRMLIQFERPDFVEVEFNPELYDGAYVNAGDTIAYIVSREGEGRIQILGAQLEMDRSSHESLVTGGRQVDLEVARAELERAEAALAAFRPELDRASSLHQAGLIADSTWVAVKGQYDVLTADVKVAEASYKAWQAGARPEDIKVARRQVDLTQQMLHSSQRLLGEREPLLSPINGRVRFRGDPEEMIRIEMTDTMAVIVLIPESSVSLLREQQPLTVSLSADNISQRYCSLFRIEFGNPDEMQAYAIGLLDNRDRFLQPGMHGQVTMSIGKTTIFKGLRARFGL